MRILLSHDEKHVYACILNTVWRSGVSLVISAPSKLNGSLHQSLTAVFLENLLKNEVVSVKPALS